MAQQLVSVGTVANDGTGDTWRDALIKLNANDTELFAFKDAQAFNFITQESDFPEQDATTITLETNQIYIPTADFSTAKRFVCEDGSVYSAFNPFGPVTTYTGTSDMFTGVNASFNIHDCQISGPSSSEIFNFSETVGGLHLFVCDTITIDGAFVFGTFDKMGAVQVINSNGIAATSGMTVTSNSTVVLSFDRFALISSSASFVGLDIGTAVIADMDLNNLIFIAPAGGIGITGAAASANVPAGNLAMVSNSSFVGGITPLQNITNGDVRWRFTDNTPIPDTIEDALLSFNGSSTETVIGVGAGDDGNPIIVDAAWVCIQSSLFGCTTGGRVTSLSERDVTVPIDVSLGLISSGGGSIDVTVYLALNGSVISASATTVSISGSTQKFVSIPWQETFSEDDYNEVFIENNTNTTNVIVESGKLRVR